MYRSKVPIQIDQFLREEMQHHAIQIPGQILHASLLGLSHPQSLKNVSWQIDPAQAFIDLFKLLGISTASWQQLVK
jgi:23S rRNA pseudouridine1911/1915/1917 synthase